MEKAWYVYWILAAIFTLGEIGFAIWAALQPTGQAMPAMILPVIAGAIGIVAFAVIAVIMAFVEWVIGS